MRFDFENLNVYQKTLDFVNFVYRTTADLPQYYQYSLGDQFRRASLSVVNNIAEGSGRFSKKDKRRFYEIALGSARECVPMIDIIHKTGFVSEDARKDMRESCEVICKMLSKLMSSIK